MTDRSRAKIAGGRGGLLFSLLISGAIWGACAGPPLGPKFEMSPDPPEDRMRVYVYRADERSSLATVNVTIDGLEVGRFRDREFETLVLAAGSHLLRASSRGFGFLAWGWNEQRFRGKPGETVYLKIAVRLAEQISPGTPELEIAGRSNAGASENVFIIPRTESAALSDLSVATRLPGPVEAED